MSERDFLQWLETRHVEMKNLILQTHGLQSQVEHILKEGHERIMADLAKFDTVLATLLTHLEGFAEMATLLKPDSGFSEGAVHILQWFVDSDAQEFRKVHTGRGEVFLLLDKQSGDSEMEVTNARFLDDDLRTLVDSGLLIRGEVGGDDSFRVTHNAARLVEALRDSGRLQSVP